MNKKLSKKISTLCKKTGICISKDFDDGFDHDCRYSAYCTLCYRFIRGFNTLTEVEYYVDGILEGVEEPEQYFEEAEQYDDTSDEFL
jgi:hypothetical protein